MILIHTTVTRAAHEKNDLEHMLSVLQMAIGTSLHMGMDEIALSGGIVDVMTAPYAVMLNLEFVYDLPAEEAARIVKFAADTMCEMLDDELEHRSVLAYHSIHQARPLITVG